MSLFDDLVNHLEALVCESWETEVSCIAHLHPPQSLGGGTRQSPSALAFRQLASVPGSQ